MSNVPPGSNSCINVYIQRGEEARYAVRQSNIECTSPARCFFPPPPPVYCPVLHSFTSSVRPPHWTEGGRGRQRERERPQTAFVLIGHLPSERRRLYPRQKLPPPYSCNLGDCGRRPTERATNGPTDALSRTAEAGWRRGSWQKKSLDVCLLDPPPPPPPLSLSSLPPSPLRPLPLAVPTCSPSVRPATYTKYILE